MGWDGLAGWAGLVLLDGAGLSLLDGPGWLCRMGWASLPGRPSLLSRMGRADFAGWSGLALPDGPGWLCQMARTGFAG
jgi:hypothetical protein